MKQKLYLISGLIIFLIIIGIVINVIRNRTPKQGELRVDSDPVSSVFLDTKHIGRSPIGKTTFKVDAGEYTVKIVPDPGVTQLVSWQEKIKIGPNVLTYISATLSESELTSSSYVLWLERITSKKAELVLTTAPDGATVLFDDEMKGVTPMSVTDVSTGDHTITIISRGFMARSMKVRFNPGYRLIASIKLALATGAQVDAEASSSGTVQGSQIEVKGSPTPTVKITGTPKISVTPKTTPSITKGFDIKIKPNDLGYLRVRLEPLKTASEVAKLKSGETYTVLDTKNDWYQISYDGNNTGWISSSTTYVEKVN